MVITQEILDELTAKAKASERLRCNLDLRNSADDQSQRMLNALEPGTEMPIHRHKGSSETCICIRGHFVEYFYDAEGRLTDTIDMVPGGVVLNIEKGQWHSLKCLESGTVLFEGKDGAYHPLDEDEIWKYFNIKNNMSVFKDKTLLITGGTGSFGNAVLNRFLRTDIGEIRIFSRDEKKQDDMRHDFQARMPEVANKIKFYIGDVRNKSTLKYAMQGVDYVFHAAALKQVPSCEFFPMEAVKTNVIGTDNTLDAAIDAGVKCVICLSTDKAAYPINAMGITKAIEEKIAVAKSRLSGNTKICCTRYGNVMCSRGSVIPLWIDQIRKGNPITITEPSMTRYIMSLEEAVDLVLFAFEHGKNGDILVQKAPACTIQTQAEAVVELFKHQAPKDPEIRVIGIRHGEKMYETLLTREEAAKAIDMGNFYAVPADNRDLNYDKYFKEGDVKRATIEEFDSNNTRRLNLEETKEKIASLTYIQNELKGIPNLV